MVRLAAAATLINLGKWECMEAVRSLVTVLIAFCREGPANSLISGGVTASAEGAQRATRRPHAAKSGMGGP